MKLSICIATLNRAGFIGPTLESIISQATDEVEIVIVDGASTDQTMQVVQQYQQKFPRLNYLRLSVKGGVDRDYDCAVGLARGEYCWLMTDDDLLKPGAIQAVLAAIPSGDSLIVVNAQVNTPDLSQCLSARQLPMDTDRVYQPTQPDRERFFGEVGFYLTFIGGVVIQRAIWNARDRQSYFGTEFVHLGVIFQSPLPTPVRVLAEPRIVIRYGNAQWTTRYFEIWMIKLADLIWGLDFSDVSKRRVCHPEPWRRPGALLLFRARGAYGLREYDQWIAPRRGTRWSKMIARVIAQLPGCAVNGLAWVYARLRRQRLLLIDLRHSPFSFQDCAARTRARLVRRLRMRSTNHAENL